MIVPRKITLDEYMSRLMDETISFRVRWRAGQKTEGKKKWPEKMDPGDWDEQFSAHLQTVHSVDRAYGD